MISLLMWLLVISINIIIIVILGPFLNKLFRNE